MKAGLKRWIGKFPDMGDVVARFPVPVLAMAVFTFAIVFKDFLKPEDTLARTLGGIIVGAYLCVSHVLASEANGRKPNLILQILLVVATAAFGLFSEVLRINLPMAIGAAVLLLGNAVIWRSKRDDLRVWDFTHKLWTGAVFATVGSIIFTIGMFSISAALKSLFGLKIDKLIEYLFLPVGLGFLAPLYWLATLPPVDEDYSELYDNPSFVSKAVTFLGTWLLSPLALIYALILLAYGVKIVMAGELPNGQIAQLTSPFLIVGALTWLVLDPPFAREKALAIVFKKLWWPVSIPAALLLAVAVFVRIREYGYTPERWALTALVVWSLGLALWFTFAPKARRDIRFIPGFAAALLAMGAVGSGWLSLINQSQRFEQNLSAAVTISEDGLVTDIKDMSAARRAKGALQYLMNNTGEARVKRVMSAASIAFEGDEFSFSNIQKTLSLNAVTLPNRYSSYNQINYDNPEKIISVAGFDNLHGPFNLSSYSGRSNFDFQSANLALMGADNVLRLKLENESLTFDFKAWKQKQKFKHNASNIGSMSVTIDTPYIVLLDTPERKVTLFIERFNSWDSDSDELDGLNLNAEFYVLTRGVN